MAITKFKSNKQPFVDASMGAAINPSLLLNFTHKNGFNSLLNVSRNSPSTRINQLGFMETAAVNTLRISYDPISLACKGLLVEPTRKNFLLNSNGFNAADWIAQGVAPTRTQDRLSPENLINAWTVNDTDSASGGGGLYQNITITPSSTNKYCLSIFISQGTSSKFDLYAAFSGSSTNGTAISYNYSTGQITAFVSEGNGTMPLAYGVENYANGWKRIWFVISDSNSGANTNLRYRFYSGGASSGQTGSSFTYGAQVELGGWPTSYIPTTSAQVERLADLITITGSNVTQWFNRLEGTMYAEFESSSNEFEDFESIFVLNTSSQLNSHGIYAKMNSSATGGGRRLVSSTFFGSTNQTQIITSFDNTSNSKVVYGYAQNSAAMAANGYFIASDNTINLPLPSVVHIGSRGGVNVFSGWIKNVTYYPKKFINDELQVLSLI